MAKKKAKFGLGSIIAGVACLLGLVALVMIFVPQLNYLNKTSLGEGQSLNGLKITFGYSETTEVLGKEVTAKILNFSFGNFLTYILVIVGMVFAVLAMLGKLGKIAPIVACAAFVVAGVLFFLALPMTSVYVGDATGDAASKIVEAFRESFKLGAGAIVGGVMAILAGLASLSTMFIKK